MDINIVESAAEVMYPRSSCARLNQLKKLARSTDSYLKHVEERKPFQVRVVTTTSYVLFLFLPTYGQEKLEQVLGRAVNSWDGMNSTLEVPTIRALNCVTLVLTAVVAMLYQTFKRHGMFLPDGLSEEMMERVAIEAGYEMSIKFSSPEICRFITTHHTP